MEQVEAINVRIAAIQTALESCKAVGLIQAMRALESEMTKEQRRIRALTGDSPAVAEAVAKRRGVVDE